MRQSESQTARKGVVAEKTRVPAPSLLRKGVARNQHNGDGKVIMRHI